MPDLPCPLAEAAVRWPDQAAIIASRSVITYRDLDRLVTTRTTGTDPVRTVMHLAETPRLDTVVRLWAAFRLGMTVALIDRRLPDRIRAGVDLDSQTITPEQLIDNTDLIREPAHLPSPDDRSGRRIIPFDAATEILTSGSTADPKRCLLSFGNHYYNALGSNTNIPLAPGDRWLLSLPLWHVGGLSILFRTVLAGATAVIPDPGQSPYDAIDAHRITHCSMVPTQLRRYLAEPASRNVLKAILLGGAPVPPPLIEAAIDRGLPIHTSYGLTEMASQVTTTPPGATPDQLRTSGRLLPHRELRIDNSGEILVRGATLARGYLDGATPRPLADPDGWYHTADLGTVDASGFLRVLGRRDNMFVSGGENIHPEMIEQTLLETPGIVEAVVVAVDDEEYGQRPFAFVTIDVDSPVDLPPLVRLIRDYITLTRGAADTPVQVRDQLKSTLPHYAVPVGFASIPDHARRGLKPDRPALERLARELRRQAAR